jgi:hypothetical protein
MKRYLTFALSLGLSFGCISSVQSAECVRTFAAPTVVESSASLPDEWFIQPDTRMVLREAPVVLKTTQTVAAPAVITGECAPVTTAPVAVTTTAPVAVTTDCAPAVQKVVYRTGLLPIYDSGLHGIRGDLNVHPIIGVRGNNVFVQPPASLIGGANPYLQKVILDDRGGIVNQASLDPSRDLFARQVILDSNGRVIKVLKPGTKLVDVSLPGLHVGL